MAPQDDGPGDGADEDGEFDAGAWPHSRGQAARQIGNALNLLVRMANQFDLVLGAEALCEAQKVIRAEGGVTPSDPSSQA